MDSEKEDKMPRGDKSTYTEKQKRQAEHIEEGYEKRGVPEEEAERRAWATVNKMTGGGKKSGSGRGKKTNTAPAKKGGHKGGAASAARSFAERSASAKKAARPANAAPLPHTVDAVSCALADRRGGYMVKPSGRREPMPTEIRRDEVCQMVAGGAALVEVLPAEEYGVCPTFYTSGNSASCRPFSRKSATSKERYFIAW